jgi:hypothetical protein
LNIDCGKESPVRDINWYDDQHIVECQHCRQYHALRLLSTEEGALLFEVVGLIDA